MAKGEIEQSRGIIQTGYSTYEPEYCKWQKLYPYQQMIELVAGARIVITHGGPSSFIMPLRIGKTPIVVPRQHKYGEHINDHQLTFVEEVARRAGTIIAVTDIEKLADTILNYDQIIGGINKKDFSNNDEFNARLGQIVNDMFAGKSK